MLNLSSKFLKYPFVRGGRGRELTHEFLSCCNYCKQCNYHPNEFNKPVQLNSHFLTILFGPNLAFQLTNVTIQTPIQMAATFLMLT